MQKTESFTKPKTRPRVSRVLGALAALAAIAALALMPQITVQGAAAGLELCFDTIIPALFPFFVLSSMLFGTGTAAAIGRFAGPFMERLFLVSGEGAAAFIVGVTGGYPLGAKAVSDIYASGGCTRQEAMRMVCFCNNSGPAFILGAAGAGVFRRADVGLLLYVAHVLAAVAVGVLTRPSGQYAPTRQKRAAAGQRPGFAEIFTYAVKSSFAACLNICGFVIFFSVLVSLLNSTGLIAAIAKTPLAESLFTGFLELGSGIASLKGLNGAAAVAAAAFILGWGGLSVHAQTLAVAAEIGLNPARLFVCRALHGIIAAALSAAGYLLLL